MRQNTQKNDFGRKIALSVLEIVSLNPLSLAVGVGACVFTANANASYKSGRMEDFAVQRKKAKSLLLIGLIGVILELAALGIFLMREGKQLIQGSPDAIQEIVLEDRKITLPLSVEEFEKLGFEFRDGLEGNVINPGEINYAGFTAPGYEDEPMDAGSAWIYNPGTEAISEKDGVIIGLDIQKLMKMNFADVDTIEIELEKGITFESTEDEVVRAYGPSEEEEESDSGVRDYVWFGENYEENYYDLRRITFVDGNMISVTIQYRGDMD